MVFGNRGAQVNPWLINKNLMKDVRYIQKTFGIAAMRSIMSEKWRGWRGSNPRPPAWQAGTLTNWATTAREEGIMAWYDNGQANISKFFMIYRKILRLLKFCQKTPQNFILLFLGAKTKNQFCTNFLKIFRCLTLHPAPHKGIVISTESAWNVMQ